MRNVARYWWHVCKLAWQETRSEVTKAFLRFVVAAIVVALLVHFGAPAIGLDKLVALAAVAVLALLAVARKLVTIPARLHEWQVKRRDYEKIARELEALFDEGTRLLHDSAARSNPWLDQTDAWELRVEKLLRGYSEQERLLFSTIGGPRRRRGAITIPAENESNRHPLKLAKLRLIAGRAYGKASGENPPFSETED